MQAVAEVVVADTAETTQEAAVIVAEVAVAEDTEAMLQAHAMAHHEKVADTKAIVTVLAEAETLVIQETLVPHVRLVAIEVRAEILLPKTLQVHAPLVLRADLHVRHVPMLQEHQDLRAQHHAHLKLHQETLTKKINTPYFPLTSKM